jgi:hypothetical protein
LDPLILRRPVQLPKRRFGGEQRARRPVELWKAAHQVARISARRETQDHVSFVPPREWRRFSSRPRVQPDAFRLPRGQREEDGLDP